ncbi:MAG: HEAT repeat domain-containing protein [Desulfuromonadales bacterium]
MLQSPEEERRLQGLRGLAESTEEFPREWIYQALGDDSWRVRKEGVDLFLRRPENARFADEVVKLLHSEENAGLRNAAMEILIRLGRQAVPHLLSEIGTQDHDVRKFILDILGEIGDPGCVPTLVEALKDPDENVRSAAAENLGKLRASEAIPALLDAMETDDLWLRFTILEALGQIGGQIDEERLLRFKDERLLRKALIDCLGRVGSVCVVPAIVEALDDDMRNVRESAVVALARIAESYPEEVRRSLSGVRQTAAADHIAELLDHQQQGIRQASLKLLGFLSEPRYAPRLLDLLDDQSMVESAMQALIAMGADGAAQLASIVSPEEPRRCAYVSYLIGETGYGAGRDFLLASIGSDEDELRMVALQALGKIGDASSIAPLVEHLENETEETRQAVQTALERIGRRCRQELTEALEPLLDSQNPELRTSVIMVLGQLLGAEFEDHVIRALKDPSPDVRRAAVTVLDGHPYDGQIRALKMALTDEDAEVRAQAAEVLGRIDDPQAVEALGLACGDEDIWVRSTAVRSLGHFENDAAFSVVSRTADDSVGLVTIAALETLTAIDAGKARPLLLDALYHRDEEVVKAAMQLLFSSAYMDWSREEREHLISHPHWDVRLTFIRNLFETQGENCRSQLVERLKMEREEPVRQAIQECLALMDSFEV